jgi:hypothetical protein
MQSIARILHKNAIFMNEFLAILAHENIEPGPFPVIETPGIVGMVMATQEFLHRNNKYPNKFLKILFVVKGS